MSKGDIIPFIIVANSTRGKENSLSYYKDIKRFVKITAREMATSVDISGLHVGKKSESEMRPCSIDDFSQSNFTKDQFYEVYRHLNPICVNKLQG